MDGPKAHEIATYMESLRPLAGVLAVLVLGASQSLYFVFKKPWCPREWVRQGDHLEYRAVPHTLEEVATSPLVSPTVLLIWRAAALLFIIGICMLQFAELGSTFHLKFYTVWNWYLLGMYFLLSIIATATYIKRSAVQQGAAASKSTSPGITYPAHTVGSSVANGSLSATAEATAPGKPAGQLASTNGTATVTAEPVPVAPGPANGPSNLRAERSSGPLPDWLQHLVDCVCVLFHINMTTVCIVDTVMWLVLVPMMTTHNPNPERAAHFAGIFYRFTSYSQHGLNAVIMLVDMWLNSVPFRFYMVGHVGTWSLMFLAWAFTWYAWKRMWLYPFLNISLPHAPLAYLGLYGAHWAFYGLWYFLYRLKMQFVGRLTRKGDEKKKKMA